MSRAVSPLRIFTTPVNLGKHCGSLDLLCFLPALGGSKISGAQGYIGYINKPSYSIDLNRGLDTKGLSKHATSVAMAITCATESKSLWLRFSEQKRR